MPVAWDWSISDLACAWGAPVLVVAPNKLGVLNHVRLTVEAITLAGLPLWGVVLNDGVSVGDEASAHNHEDLVQLLSGSGGCNAWTTWNTGRFRPRAGSS